MDHTTTKSAEKNIQELQRQPASSQGSGKKSLEFFSDELEALSYSVSHDLRAPLRAIRHNCEWLSSQHGSDFNAKESTLLQQITECSELMESLLDGLLAFSKVVKSNPKNSLVDMTVIAKKIIDELLESESDPSSVSITIAPLAPAYGDEILLRQVWYNLLSNAFKYTQYKERRIVAIESRSTEKEVVYCITDNGIGFDMKYIDRLFGVFQRLHGVEEFQGTGVGLAIVKRIIQRHGGRVWAESEPEHGARFYFTLPKT
jgi:light-regulated signal transduction histidine kinase (bacteriophytochrome)